MALTLEQVSTLAPDASGLAAGKKTSDARMWAGLGQSDAALWGECKGSAVYQVRVSLTDFASKCSCPSRKFPCKHALGLMFLVAKEPGRVPAAEPPEWVDEWLTKRDGAAQRKRERAEQPAAPPDPKAQARRSEKRADRVLAGVDALDLWMRDLARTGLATVAARGDQPWREQAARLVDAQAPALGSRLRRLGSLPRSAPDFAERLAEGLGRIALLTHAVRRLDALAPALATDVRTNVGWTLERDEVIATGERVSDHWLVVGQVEDDDERVRMQRTWLRGAATARFALVVQFAAGGARFTEALPPGAGFEGELAFWPSAFPLRALVSKREGELRPWPSPSLPGFGGAEAMLLGYAEALARQPWIDAFPAALAKVVPAPLDAAADRFAVVDEAGGALELTGAAGWRLFALSGGQPLELFGEWDGRVLLPLGAWAEGRFFSLGARSFGA
jgi:hypothetical protein